MRPPPIVSTFHAADWFLDCALNDSEYLQPQKLHRLLYLAQAYYGVAKAGRMLMPSVFVADPMGPLEPNIFAAYENDRPWITKIVMDKEAEQFLDSIWRRFGVHSADHLTRVLKRHAPYADVFAMEPGGIIPLGDMVSFYGADREEMVKRQTGAPGAESRSDPGPGAKEGSDPVSRIGKAPTVEAVVRPRVMRSHTGKPVNVVPWMPKKK